MKKITYTILAYAMVCLIFLGSILLPMLTVKAADATIYTYNNISPLASVTDAGGFPGFPAISSSSCVLMDAGSGQVVYAKNPDSVHAPGSLSKLMTVYLAISQGDLESIITMSDAAVWGVDRNGAHIALDVGEQITVSDAIYGVVLQSANEAAWAIGEQISGSIPTFAELMNETAQSFGCKNTNFKDAHGQAVDSGQTSAYDIALMTKNALTNNTFCSYFEARYHEIAPTNMNNETRYLNTTNKLFLPDSGFYDSRCLGGKNSFCDADGSAMCVWAEVNGMRLICVTMGAKDNDTACTDVKTILDYVSQEYTYATPLEDFEFNAEDATKAQTFLNELYNCENLGTMHLSIDSAKPIVFAKRADPAELETIFTPSKDRLEEGIIGSLEIKYHGVSYLSLPVSYSGYVNSKDDAAVAQAYKDGTIRDALINKKKGHLRIVVVVLMSLFTILLFVYAHITRPPDTRK